MTAAYAALCGVDPFAYLLAEPDDSLIVRAVTQKAMGIHAEQRRTEIEVLGKVIASELSKLF